MLRYCRPQKMASKATARTNNAGSPLISLLYRHHHSHLNPQPSACVCPSVSPKIRQNRAAPMVNALSQSRRARRFHDCPGGSLGTQKKARMSGAAVKAPLKIKVVRHDKLGMSMALKVREPTYAVCSINTPDRIWPSATPVPAPARQKAQGGRLTSITAHPTSSRRTQQF